MTEIYEQNGETLPGKARPTWRERAGFLWWGVRYRDIAAVIAFPTTGAVMALDRFTPYIAGQFALFTLCNVLLIIHVFIFNDWSDAILNPDEPGRRARHALKHPAFTRSQILLISVTIGAAALTAYYLLLPRLALIAAFLIFITAAYSHPWINLKGQPLVSTLIHLVGGAFYFIMGWNAFAPITYVAIGLGLFFGLVLSAGHFANEIDDFHQDLAAGIRTNTIAFGQRTMFRVGLFLYLASSLFLVILAVTSLGPMFQFLAFALFYFWVYLAWRFRNWKGGDDIHAFRNYYRLIYANFCTFIVMVKLEQWVPASWPYWWTP